MKMRNRSFMYWNKEMAGPGKHKKIAHTLVRALQNLYNQANSQLNNGNKLSESFPSLKVEDKDALSPQGYQDLHSKSPKKLEKNTWYGNRTKQYISIYTTVRR